jgi:hypothetical protein
LEACRVDFDALPWQSQLAGARYKVYAREGRRLRLVEFSHGFAESDWCLKGHIGYVLEGEMDVDFSGDLVHFSAGDGICISAGPESKHMVRVLSNVVRVVLVEDE